MFNCSQQATTIISSNPTGAKLNTGPMSASMVKTNLRALEDPGLCCPSELSDIT